jgi:hypothetical protein
VKKLKSVPAVEPEIDADPPADPEVLELFDEGEQALADGAGQAGQLACAYLKYPPLSDKEERVLGKAFKPVAVKYLGGAASKYLGIEGMLAVVLFGLFFPRWWTAPKSVKETKSDASAPHSSDRGIGHGEDDPGPPVDPESDAPAGA